MTDNRYGNIDIDTTGYENQPIREFLKDKKSSTSRENYRRWKGALQENENGSSFQQFLNNRQKSVFDATIGDLEDYTDHLQSQGAEKTIDHRLSKISALYKCLRAYGVHDSNPAAYVLDDGDFDKDSPSRNYHTVAEIGDFIKGIPEPQMQTAALMLPKTGIRGGEICNIDLCCLHLDDDRYREDYLDRHEIELRDEIKNRPDTLYIYEYINEGDIVKGEKRPNGNKRKRSTLIPIDNELKQSLLNWLSIRPRISDTTAQPLFTTQEPVNGKYKRAHSQNIYSTLIGSYAYNFGISEPGGNRSDVDLHYFRHFFTTQMAKGRGDHDGGLDPMLIKYIRGDVIDDNILNIYTHDSWGVNVREDYLENIYNFGIYE